MDPASTSRSKKTTVRLFDDLSNEICKAADMVIFILLFFIFNFSGRMRPSNAQQWIFPRGGWGELEGFLPAHWRVG